MDGRTQKPASTPPRYLHAHRTLPERCRGRMACMRACPTEAIRVRAGKAVVADDLCVDCGTCLTVCPSGAVVPIVDPPGEAALRRHEVVVPSPVLYAQFPPHVHPYLVQLALRKLGFDEVVDTTRLSAELGRALQLYLARRGGPVPLISNHCPAVVRFIQVKYPGLVEHISPLDVPRELTARAIRRTARDRFGAGPGDVGIVYVAPCPAKVVASRQPAEKARSSFDGVVSVRDIYARVRPIVERMLPDFDARCVPADFCYDGGWAIFGGMTRSIGMDRWLAVSGMGHVRQILDDIENSRLRHIDFVEASAHMQGCVSGPLNAENPYVARANAIKLRRDHGRPPALDDEAIAARLAARAYHMEHVLLPRPSVAFDADLKTSIRWLRERDRVYEKLPQIDCGCCGAPTCLAFAEDFARGRAELTDCVHFRAPVSRS